MEGKNEIYVPTETHSISLQQVTSFNFQAQK